MAFVLDASITLAWHFEDEACDAASALSRRALREGVVVPQHWFSEVANGLLRGERRDRTEPASTARFLARMADFSIRVDGAHESAVFPTLLPLARAWRLSVYDAAYLELAQREGLALATLDAALAGAAQNVGIAVLGEAVT